MIDVRDQLPFEDNVFGTYDEKTSLTFHWNGPPVEPTANPLSILKADAAFHISKGWGGISYHKAIAPDGTVFVTRDPEAVLAACGNAIGNARSTHVQVMIGTGQSPSEPQWESMADLAREQHTVYPHNFWSGTQCPGPDITEWINQKGWEEDMALREEFEEFKKETNATIETMKKTYNPLYHHVHLPGSLTPSATTEALVPPVDGAQYSGSSADLAQILWRYSDGTVHTYVDGKEVTP